MKSRLHSHLLTGRLENHVLKAFATEVFKRGLQKQLESASEFGAASICEIENSFHVPQHIFTQAARKATFQSKVTTPTKSILKKRLNNERNSIDLRNLRAINRSRRLPTSNGSGYLRSDMNFFPEDCSNSSNKHDEVDQNMAFEQSDWHFSKRIQEHPQNGIEDQVRVLDQRESSPDSSILCSDGKTQLKPGYTTASKRSNL